MTSKRLVRINKEMKDLYTSDTQKELSDNGITMIPDTQDIFVWDVIIKGPKDTAYEGGTFLLTFEATQNYPFEPPNVRFVTKVYHMNVSPNGYICLDILKRDEGWSMALYFKNIAKSIVSLLSDPNPDSPLVPEIAALYKHDRDAHFRQARKHTLDHATKSDFNVGEVPEASSSQFGANDVKGSGKVNDPICLE